MIQHQTLGRLFREIVEESQGLFKVTQTTGSAFKKLLTLTPRPPNDGGRKQSGGVNLPHFPNLLPL